EADSYRRLSEADLATYLAGVPRARKRLGGESSGWSVREVGDGNLNLVFIVKGPKGGVAVKQALPFVRLVGESWPLPLSRANFENLALTQQAELAPGLVPAVLHFDERMKLIVMELLEPHIILRRGLIGGTRYPRLAEHLSTFLARTLFCTSDLALEAAEKKRRIAAFAGNHALCKITEDLIFTDPYRKAEQNRWTEPYLDALAEEFRDDLDLHVAISRLKLKFLSSAEAMIHGDLHTGSVMVTQEETRVIDPEFAFYGPMGFDIGALIANLLMNFLANEGHEKRPGERASHGEWVLETTGEIWHRFRAKFLELWRKEAKGDAYPVTLFPGPSGAARLEIERQSYMDALFNDTVGFAGAKIVRRILGLAHNIDFEWIDDKACRATCEARALRLARELLVNAPSFSSIEGVIEAAGRAASWDPGFR
ncbi:MAG: S-methyl-5-thioribose kinase, partial [Hyphomicrobiales bacterium]|nr:S-methyl-5-thioribose kinase [Hyphomicrobiales bacterium]